MTAIVLLLALAFALIGFGVRTAVQIRRTGDSGWRMGGERTPATAVSHLALALSPVLLVVGLLLDLADSRFAGGWEVPSAVEAGGLLLAVVGLLLTVAAQLDLGSSWRIGVDESEQTDLITDGLYRWVRNPIFTGMAVFLVGEALVVPNPWTVGAAVLGILGMEVQTRLVEEPHLVRTHGPAYAGWAASTGRFLPGIGR